MEGSRQTPYSPTQHSSVLIDRYRCPGHIPDFEAPANLIEADGYFRFDSTAICYGKTVVPTEARANSPLPDVAEHVQFDGGVIRIPFDPDQVISNLRYERYAQTPRRWIEKTWPRELYYMLRPLLPVALRMQLQKVYLRDWDGLPFPSWPVDRNVDILHERLLSLAMRHMGIGRLPFIWFWPEGHSSCALLTHDIETENGRDFTGQLMDIDDDFGVKAAFQIVPEKRYRVSEAYMTDIRNRGFEVNIHGLDHEGNLFESRETFLKRVWAINNYARSFGARGFRSPSMYRNADWLHELDFSYDMSVPNVARLEAQRGGCCTLMPYFLPGGMLELPLTTVEDYTLFNMLGDYSLTLWKEQMDLIREHHGLVSFLRVKPILS